MKRPMRRRLYIKMIRMIRKAGRKHRRNAETLQSARVIGPRIVAIGGGTGLSTLLRGLKSYTENITAIVTVADDGGGSGVLREELGMLPPGDIRNCITALANAEPTMIELMNYRFTDGVYKGQSFGNLLLAAMNGVCGSFEEAVARTHEVLAVTGKVVPVTGSNVNLVAEFEDGSSVRGESKIYLHKKQHQCRITRVHLEPKGSLALPAAIEAIAQADLILLGPGSLYTSVIPNLLVGGVVNALANASAPKVYIMNVMTQDGETEGYTAIDHIRALTDHAGGRQLINACIYNTAPVSEALCRKYRFEGAEPVQMDRERFLREGIEPFGYPLMQDGTELARHDPQLLAEAIMDVFAKKVSRGGIYGAYDTMVNDK
ncbi:MAG: uridine diphosphate-N-acetylglucosamine-binding protein YvcK [Butyricicoccaceae bacterium]